MIVALRTATSRPAIAARLRRRSNDKSNRPHHRFERQSDPPIMGDGSGDLIACENDANDMTDIARCKALQSPQLLTKAATGPRSWPGSKKCSICSKLAAMLFLLRPVGELPNKNRDEADAMDETWCLYDGQLSESTSCTGFLESSKPGCASSCCPTAVTAAPLQKISTIGPPRCPEALPGQVRYRFMPIEIEQRTYRANRAFYDSILKNKALKRLLEIRSLPRSCCRSRVARIISSLPMAISMACLRRTC